MNVETALQLLQEKGYKNTKKREQLLKVVFDEKRYLSAKDVLKLMQAYYPKLSFDTIYRNLALLTQLGILEMTEFAGEKKFRFSCTIKQHHHHIICLDCGVTKQIELCPMEQLSGNITDFLITGHKFEVYGHCQNCI